MEAVIILAFVEKLTKLMHLQNRHQLKTVLKEVSGQDQFVMEAVIILVIVEEANIIVALSKQTLALDKFIKEAVAQEGQ